MKCSIIECTRHEDCVILEITKKEPKKGEECSYFRTLKQDEKKKKKEVELEEAFGKRRKRRKVINNEQIQGKTDLRSQ